MIASTPSAYTGVTAPARGPGRVRGVRRTRSSSPPTAASRASAPRRAAGHDGAAARGPRERRHDRPTTAATTAPPRASPGGWRARGSSTCRSTPPAKDTFGSLCIRNLGSSRDRARRQRERPRGLAADGDRRRQRGPAGAAAAAHGARPPQRGLARSGEVTTHAATLKPFGAWWMWVLALGLLTLAPLGVWLRDPLRARDRRRGAGRSTARGRRSSGTRSACARRLAAIPGWLVLALVAAVAIAVAGLLEPLDARLPERRVPVRVSCRAGCRATSPRRCSTSPSTGAGCSGWRCGCWRSRRRCSTRPWSLHGGRILNMLAFVSTAIPVYKLGRAQGLRSHWAALPASVLDRRAVGAS